MTTRSSDADSDRYFASRYRADARRDGIWRHIAAYLSQWWTTDAAVLDLGAGYCSFINSVSARRRVALDVHPGLGDFADTGVTTVQGSATSVGEIFGPNEFDVVFSSNLLEHLERPDITRVLDGCLRVLRPRGRLILMGPNYRLCAKRYWDDYTHVTALSDTALADFAASRGFEIEAVQARFLPFSMKTRLAGLSRLVPLYLRSPIRPLAGQMLIVARKPSA